MIFVSAAGSDAAATAGCALVLDWLFQHRNPHTATFCNVVLRLAAHRGVGGPDSIFQISNIALHSHHGLEVLVVLFFRERGGERRRRAKKNSCETLIIKDCHFRVMIFSQRELQEDPL